MDRVLKDLFGGDDEPTAQHHPAASTETAPTGDAAPTAKRDEAEREARREARRQRKADPERRRKRDDFVERYTTGDPSEGFSTDEAIEHLRDLREEMTPAEFRAAMQRTLEHLPPSQRDDFIALMQQYKAGQPAAAPGATPAARDAAADPFGGLLTSLMGGGVAGAGGVGVGDVLDDLRRSGTRAPSPAPGQQPTAADFEALLNSPLARAVLGGVAAYGMQGVQGDENDHDAPGGTRSPA